jgi:hypothetical protein
MIVGQILLLFLAFVLLLVAGWLQPLNLWQKLLCWGLAAFVGAEIVRVAVLLK